MKKYYIYTSVVAVICLMIGLAAGIFVGIKRGGSFCGPKRAVDYRNLQRRVAVYFPRVPKLVEPGVDG